MRFSAKNLSPNVISQFRTLCIDSGYADFVSSFLPSHIWLASSTVDCANLEPTLRAFYKILTGDSASISMLDPAVVVVLQELRPAGLASFSGECSLNGLAVSFFSGSPYFHGSLELLDRFYFGEDSIALRQ